MRIGREDKSSKLCVNCLELSRTSNWKRKVKIGVWQLEKLFKLCEGERENEGVMRKSKIHMQRTVVGIWFRAVPPHDSRQSQLSRPFFAGQ